MNKVKRLFHWNTGLVIILILEILIFGIINPRFLNPSALFSSFNDFACISIIALFETFVVVTGGTDISIGSIIGLTSTIIGVAWKAGHMSIGAAVVLALVVGAACGFFNGALIAFTNVQSMVVTLGSMLLFGGIGLVISGMSGTSASEGISGLPDSFVNLANGSVGLIPNLFIAFLILACIAYVILHKTKYGKYVFLVGINKNTARYSGINSKVVTMFTYVLTDISAAIAGIVLTSYIGSCRPDLGAEDLMPTLTAVFLGGTAMTGGKGGVVGSAIAGILVGLLSFGLQMAGVPSQYTNVGVGLVLIISVTVRGATDENSIIYKTIWRLKKKKLAANASH